MIQKLNGPRRLGESSQGQMGLLQGQQTKRPFQPMQRPTPGGFGLIQNQQTSAQFRPQQQTTAQFTPQVNQFRPQQQMANNFRPTQLGQPGAGGNYTPMQRPNPTISPQAGARLQQFQAPAQSGGLTQFNPQAPISNAGPQSLTPPNSKGPQFTPANNSTNYPSGPMGGARGGAPGFGAGQQFMPAPYTPKLSNKLNAQQQLLQTTQDPTKRGQIQNKIDRIQNRIGKKQFGLMNNFNSPFGAMNMQFQANTAAAQASDLLNRGNESNFGGDREYTYDENGRLVIKDSLSQEMQDRFNAEQSREMGLHTAQQGYMDQLQKLSGQGLRDFAGDRTQIENDIYGNFERKMTPQFQQERESLEQSLAQRGIPIGSELYNEQLRQLEDRQNSARQDARFSALQGSGAEQDRLFQMGLQQRQLPMQEFGMLQGLQKGFQAPQFTGPSSSINYQAPDVMNAWNAQQDRRQQMKLAKMSRGGGGGGGGMYTIPDEAPPVTPDDPSTWVGIRDQYLIPGLMAGAGAFIGDNADDWFASGADAVADWWNS